jgi:hypothetical protein
MFDHRSNKIILRKKFEERARKKSESFSDYMYQKVILENHMSIEEEKYIIDGIPVR